VKTTQLAWNRWKRFAAAAARAQGNVLFFLLYFIAIVPMGLLRLGRSSDVNRPGAAPQWREHRATPDTLDAARRQF
jgi:hypothetical protein